MNGYRIRQARELARMTQAELAEAVGTGQSMIAQMESGRLAPPTSMSEAIAFHLGFPLAFFERGMPPHFPLGSLQFRSQPHSTLAADERDEAIRFGQIELEILMVLSKRVRNKIVLRLPQLADEPCDIQTAAELTRSALGVSADTPLPHLVRLMEQAGVIILMLPTRFEKCDAFSLWVNMPSPRGDSEVKRPLAVLSGEVSGDRLRFSVAHEIGHLVLHQIIRGTEVDREEEANAFAAELLLPEKAMRGEITTPVTLTSLSRLKPIWGVSLRSLVYRARALGIITERQCKYLFSQLSVRGWRTEEPIQLPREKPRALRQIAEIVYGDGTPQINFQRLAHNVDMHPLFVKRIMSMYATREEYSRDTVKRREEVEQLFQEMAFVKPDDDHLAYPQRTHQFLSRDV
jgi:Zn-dependent peptidase ImmA (M78 family)/DNA-binding XRE family transcriptional regulator